MTVPLTKRRKDGTVYERPHEVEALLTTIAALPRQQLVERALIQDRRHPDYLPSECLVHFVRASRSDNSDAWFEQLYKILLARVLRALPRADKTDSTTSFVNESIRNGVTDRFVHMLLQDRRKPDDKLDFFEVRFDLAIKRLRLDAQERAWREQNRREPLDSADDAPNREAADAVDPLDANILSDPLFRDRVYQAIDALPPEQSRTMHLLLLGWPTDSKDPEVMTIAKALGCTDRSVRNYRERAMKTLVALFNAGDEQ